MKGDFIFTSESVTEGHPDKLCDQISDAVVDAYLAGDPYSRIIAECAVAEGMLFLATRFASTTSVDVAEVARRTIHGIGYSESPFNARDCSILTSFRDLPLQESLRVDEHQLSDEALNRLVCDSQVNAFGYACDQTSAYLPLPIWLAHRLARRLNRVRLSLAVPYLAPDAKTQAAIEYVDGRPRRIHGLTLVVSQQDGSVSPGRLHDDLLDAVIAPVFEQEVLRPDGATIININPDGPVVGGGPMLHAGLTGRKNAIDTYGEYSRQSGAALSGKDPLRIDRVGPYAARHAAKNVVAAGLARECEIQLSYSIGQAAPVSLIVETFGTGIIDDRDIAERLAATLDFRLGAIVRRFNLRHQPANLKGGFYQRLAAYGHVGRMDIGLPWERTEAAKALR